MQKSATIYQTILDNTASGVKMFGVLIDPDKQNAKELLEVVELCNNNAVDFFLVGGSVITTGDLNTTTRLMKENTRKPIVIFPGNATQITAYADAILFLSLISGRNSDLLIGQQVVAAPFLKKTALEIIPTGYLLVDCGTTTTAIDVSDTNPIPHKNSEIAANTALAGEYLGLNLTYIDGGSGAKKCVSTAMIAQTKAAKKGPLIIGGGIRTVEAAAKIYKAGADMIVVGNAAEDNNKLIAQIAAMKKQYNTLG